MVSAENIWNGAPAGELTGSALLHDITTKAREHYINGKFYNSDKGFFPVYNPATAQQLCWCYNAHQEDIELAISTSEEAFKTWSKTPPIERSRILLAAVKLIRKNNNTLAMIESLDTGKPYAETSTVDITTGADVLEYFAGLGMGMGEGKTIQLRETAWVYTRKEPLGICVGIGAWNYPLQMYDLPSTCIPAQLTSDSALWKCAPALAAGNTFIFKPSEVTPLSALCLAKIFSDAGLPPGVFNVIQGGALAGKLLVSHPRVAKVSFTGQPQTGINVYQAAAKTLKPVTLELGGKSPFIVFPDCNLTAAVDCCLTANFFSSGQVCTNGTRVFIHKKIHRSFSELLVQRVEELIRIGNPLHPDTNFGPLVSKQHMEKVLEYIRFGTLNDHATLLYSGSDNVSIPPTWRNGYWVAPTIFTDCTDDMRIVREEIFGPVACLLSFDTIEEVISRANGTPLGLAAGVFTENINIANRVMNEVKAGICWVNTWGESPAQMPVGGWGLSGLGFENGQEALQQFTKNKSVLMENGVPIPAFSKL